LVPMTVVRTTEIRKQVLFTEHPMITLNCLSNDRALLIINESAV
jgi:hypothetical protein